MTTAKSVVTPAADIAAMTNTAQIDPFPDIDHYADAQRGMQLVREALLPAIPAPEEVVKSAGAWLMTPWRCGPYWTLYRSISGRVRRPITDACMTVWTEGAQWDDGHVDPPSVCLPGHLLTKELNSDQARELAAALLEAAAEVDGWVTR